MLSESILVEIEQILVSFQGAPERAKVNWKKEGF